MDGTELLAQCRAGDRVAVEQLVRDYQPQLFRLALSILDDGSQNGSADAQEVTQDALLAALRSLGMELKDIVTKAKQDAPEGITIEVEVTTPQEALEAVAAGADIIMLDNMSYDEMQQAVNLISGRAKVEASGGITLANVRQAAMTGVDIISIGALTHSVKALDISLEIEPQTLKLI